MKQLFRLVIGLALIGSAPLALRAQAFNDTLIYVGPGNCPGSPSANFTANAAAGAGTGMTVVAASFIPVSQVSSSAAATDQISCDLSGPSRSTSGKGMNSIAGFALFYGIVTTTATSESAPACVSLSGPAPGTSETASVAAGTAVAVTSVPVVGSANLTAVNTGQFYTTYLSFTTPPSLPVSATNVYTRLICAFAFGQSAASAMVVNSPGGIIFTTNTIAWLKRHPYQRDIEALAAVGIGYRTRNLLLAHYKIGPTLRQLEQHRYAGTWSCEYTWGEDRRCLMVDPKDNTAMAKLGPNPRLLMFPAFGNEIRDGMIALK